MNSNKLEPILLQEYPSLYRFAYTYVKNEADAMDIVQDSVYKAMTRCNSVHKESAVKGWLMSIVAHTAIDFLRKQKHETSADKIPDSPSNDTYEDLDLLNALSHLNEKERIIVTLRYFEDRKLSEISSTLGIKESTVKTTLYRALKKLKINLTEGSAE